MHFFKKIPAFIFLLLIPFLLHGNDFTPGQWAKIKQYASSRLVEKLEKARELDYDEEYQRKYASQGLLVRERVAQRIAEQVDKVQQKLMTRLKLTAAEYKAYYKAVKKKAGSKISNTSYPGIWFLDENDNLFKQEAIEQDLTLSKVVTSAKKCMLLFDIESMVINISSTTDGDFLMAMGTINSDDYHLPCLFHDKEFVDTSSEDDIDAVVAHEFTHAIFRHAYWLHPENFTCHDTYQILGHYYEKQANTHASLIFPRQRENFEKERLIRALWYPSSEGLKDNDPVKGHFNPDKEEPHPSYLLAYISAFKIRNLFEAEQRWFSTEEANECYGSVYYERAWQQWAEQQAEKKRSVNNFLWKLFVS